jgi:hypothetical protein
VRRKRKRRRKREKRDLVCDGVWIIEKELKRIENDDQHRNKHQKVIESIVKQNETVNSSMERSERKKMVTELADRYEKAE